MNKFEVIKIQFSFEGGDYGKFIGLHNHGNGKEFQTYIDAEKYIENESLNRSENIYVMFIIDRNSKCIVGVKNLNDKSVTQIN